MSQSGILLVDDEVRNLDVLESFLQSPDYRLVRALVAGVRAEPALNAWYEGRTGRRHLLERIDVGIAADLPEGLFVPVLRNAEDLSFVGLQRAISDLAERARAKKLRPDEVQGGTFTVTNLDDSGAGSLRQAIEDANANADADTITFQAGLTGTITVLPPQSSATSSWPDSSCLTRSGEAPSLSILLTATMIGTSAAFAWLIASIVCGMTPSSAATTSTTMSVTWAPRMRILENAA